MNMRVSLENKNFFIDKIRDYILNVIILKLNFISQIPKYNDPVFLRAFGKF